MNTGETDDQLGSGWHGVEEDGVNRWQWMGVEARLLARLDHAKATLQIERHAVTDHLERDQLALQSFVVQQRVGEQRLNERESALTFEVPDDLLEDEFVRTRLSLSDSFVPNGELRELGIMVHNICFWKSRPHVRNHGGFTSRLGLDSS